ncbi:MAG: 23S rRNA (uracil(1939)-C(5))-methyltransferase RlmD [Lachnospiraceae bacterium]|nr:23S rRNA (uracil(1939)-C(5))-methyltransferase RlmD [Lachnospiraceae bacterium]
MSEKKQWKSGRNVARERKQEGRHTSPLGACDLMKKCGGCQYQGMSYEKQLEKKQREVKALLGKYCKVEPIIGMKAPFHYRNKVNATFAYQKNRGIISGVYQQGTHKVVCVDECQIEDQSADQIIYDIRGLLRSFKIQAYDEDSGYGLLRHVLVRRGFSTGQVMVVLVLASPILPSKNQFVKVLRQKHPEISTVVLNVNDRRTSMVLGKRNITLYGKGYIEDVLCGLRFRISPSSFYQINPVQTEKLYSKAMEFAGLTGKERVIDAYCGIGTIGMVAAAGCTDRGCSDIGRQDEERQHVKKPSCGAAGEVIGVELNPDAVRDAITNSKCNGIKNITFYQEDAGAFMVKLAEAGEHVDVVFMDPPRAGSDEAFLGALVKLSPSRVVYISCDPHTQARDLEYLTGHGYQVKRCQPVDMFPFTVHVETVVLLSQLRQKADDYIHVDVDVAELEVTSAETKATYEKIKKYVAEHNDGECSIK